MSQYDLNAFGVGIETWRCRVLLPVEGSMNPAGVDEATERYVAKHVARR